MAADTSPPPVGDEHDVVDEVGEESFPASDAPGWWSGPPSTPPPTDVSQTRPPSDERDDQ